MAAIINPFDAGGYTLAEMTTAINILPNIYTRLGELGLFRFEGVTQRSVIIEQAEGVLEPPADRSARRARDGRQPRHRARCARSRVPWIPHDDVITPQDIQGVRGFGVADAADPLADRDGAQAHPHAGQARADPGVHGDQRAARRRQGRRRLRALRLLRRVRPRAASRSTSCSGPPAPMCRPSAARCCATSRPSSRARP